CVGSELDRAHALVRCRDQHHPERARKRAIRDALALAPGPVLARLHAERGFFVEPRYRAVTRVEHRVGNPAPVLQRCLYRFDSVSVVVIARGDAEGLLEATLQVKPACADGARELAQGDALAAPGIEVGLRFVDETVHSRHSTGWRRLHLSASCAYFPGY